MQEKLHTIEKEAILELSNKWNLHYPGIRKFIITKDQKFYSYYNYLFMSPFLRENNLPQEYLSEGQELTEEELLMIYSFIKKNIIKKEYQSQYTRDFSTNLRISYNEKEYVFVNCDYLNKKVNNLIKKIEKRLLNDLQ